MEWLDYLEHYLGEHLVEGNIKNGAKALQQLMDVQDGTAALRARVAVNPGLLSGILMAAVSLDQSQMHGTCCSRLKKIIPSDFWNKTVIKSSIKIMGWIKAEGKQSALVSHIALFLVQQAVLQDRFLEFHAGQGGKPAKELVVCLVSGEKQVDDYIRWLDLCCERSVQGIAGGLRDKLRTYKKTILKKRDEHLVRKFCDCVTCSFSTESLSRSAELLAVILEHPSRLSILKHSLQEEPAVTAGLLIGISQNFAAQAFDINQVVEGTLLGRGIVEASLKLSVWVVSRQSLPAELVNAVLYLLGCTHEYESNVFDYLALQPNYKPDLKGWLSHCLDTRGRCLEITVSRDELARIRDKIDVDDTIGASSLTLAHTAAASHIKGKSKLKQVKSNRQIKEQSGQIASENSCKTDEGGAGIPVFVMNFMRDGECSICTEYFDDECHQAKHVACPHTYCKECLMRLKAEQRYLCPTCSADMGIQNQRIKELRTNSRAIDAAKMAQYMKGILCPHDPD